MLHNHPIPSSEIRCDWVIEYLAEFRKANPEGGVHSQSLEDVRRLLEEGEEIILQAQLVLGW